MTAAFFTRRNLIGGIAATTFCQSVKSVGAADTETRTLKDLAGKRGILFGAAAVSYEINRDPALAELYAREAAIIVPDFEMKWSVVRPAAGTYSYDGADALVGFAEKRGLLIRGHTLAWEEFNPPWMNTVLTFENAERYLVDHIEKLVGRYKGRVHSWDVVNEPLWPDHRKPGGLRDGIWLRTLGPRYINIAFETARRTDPNALLVLNETGFERDGQTRRLFLELLDHLKSQNVPIDAIGLECHMSANSPFDEVDFQGFLKVLSDRGYKLLITELDVSDLDVTSSDTSERDEAVAARYSLVAQAAVSNPEVIAILTWELADNRSWLRDKNLRGAHLRKDGSPLRPLLFDDLLERKKAWYALAKVFG